MEKNRLKTEEPRQQEDDRHQQNPHNPFKEDVAAQEPTPDEEAALEQQRKEALTERD